MMQRKMEGSAYLSVLAMNMAMCVNMMQVSDAQYSILLQRGSNDSIEPGGCRFLTRAADFPQNIHITHRQSVVLE
jgi:hypothetical protein